MVEAMKLLRSSRWLTWGILGIVLLGFVSTIALLSAGCLSPYDVTESSQPGSLVVVLSGLAYQLVGFVFTLIGILIITYRPVNRIGWVALFFGFMWIVNTLSLVYGVCAHRGNLTLPAGDEILWLFNLTSSLTVIFLGLFLMLFPDGKFLSPRWRRLSLAMITLIFLLTLVTLFWPGQLLKIVPNPAPDLQNPFALPLETARPWEVIVFPVKDIVMMIFPLLGFISIFFRWRHAEGDVRQQIKWIVLFLMTAGMVFFSVELIGTTVYPSIFDSWWYPFETIIFLLGFPIVFGLAVFKYRLYDIDIIIRRTLVYSLVTLALVLVYFGSVILLQRLFTGVSGQQSPLAIVLSTLLIAALFNPLRHSVQDVIDRRFYRKKYDAQQVLAQFAQTARDETDMAVLVAELVQVAQETMQPEGLGIWLKNDRS